MSDEFWLFLIFGGGSSLFIAGVLFHKYVISEAEALKKHVTDEIAEVRVDLAESLKKAAEKL